MRNSRAIFTCFPGYIYLCLRSFMCVCAWLCTSVTLCNVLMLKCVSGLKAISSPVSISILYSFYLQPSEIQGLFVFVLVLSQQLI